MNYDFCFEFIGLKFCGFVSGCYRNFERHRLIIHDFSLNLNSRYTHFELKTRNIYPFPLVIPLQSQPTPLTYFLFSGAHRKRKQMLCKGCNLWRSHCAHGYCGFVPSTFTPFIQHFFRSCYIREKIKNGEWTKENQRQCVHCHEVKRHYAKGLCR